MLKPGKCHTNNLHTFSSAENDTTHGILQTNQHSINIFYCSVLQRNENVFMAKISAINNTEVKTIRNSN